MVAKVDKTLTHFSTDEGLAAPGATALFRVFAALTCATENANNPIGGRRSPVSEIIAN